ncbi:MAG: NAD-dependent malic enzyme [Bacteroidales bacterium]|jgi:malate dehydrogenase (oxaloacetate-decarboxylating)|nr:NAD-dependent malic enzyme [Bacteroidales bacterium]
MNYISKQNIDLSIDLSNIEDFLPADFSQSQKASCKTLFYKKLASLMHRQYAGKMQMLPKVPIGGLNWFNVWYTPGVSAISTAIRDNNDLSYTLSNRSNLVAVLSDSTRVLGDGDCTPPGGLGVMEGKALLMKYLGGIDAFALCIDSKDEKGENQADKIIDCVLMLQHSFGAINLEDISQPNCFKVLDVLRQRASIPVWHDDAQGTACVILAALLNALKLANKKLENAKIVLFGAGAANTSIATLLMADGAQGKNIIMYDVDGSLHDGRTDYKNNPLYYRQWDLCKSTNPLKITSIEEGFKDADVLIALSKPGPDTIAKEWISLMAQKAIVFVCSNPVPEIYPCDAMDAGAFIVATGRGDFPNQANNSICFPSVLKGTLLVRSRKITDTMTLAAAHAIADFACKKGLRPDNIVPKMTDTELFPLTASEVGYQAVKEGLARISMSKEEIYTHAKHDIQYAQQLIKTMEEKHFLQQPDKQLILSVLNETIGEMMT